MSPEERERIYDLFLELRRLGPQERAKALDESGLSPEAREELIDLYVAWNASEPGKGLDAKAAAWKAAAAAPDAATR
jgi:hypothetical protein